jgi:hypothetical protein
MFKNFAVFTASWPAQCKQTRFHWGWIALWTVQISFIIFSSDQTTCGITMTTLNPFALTCLFGCVLEAISYFQFPYTHPIESPTI